MRLTQSLSEMYGNHETMQRNSISIMLICCWGTYSFSRTASMWSDALLIEVSLQSFPGRPHCKNKCTGREFGLLESLDVLAIPHLVLKLCPETRHEQSLRFFCRKPAHTPNKDTRAVGGCYTQLITLLQPSLMHLAQLELRKWK